MRTGVWRRIRLKLFPRHRILSLPSPCCSLEQIDRGSSYRHQFSYIYTQNRMDLRGWLASHIRNCRRCLSTCAASKFSNSIAEHRPYLDQSHSRHNEWGPLARFVTDKGKVNKRGTWVLVTVPACTWLHLVTPSRRATRVREIQ